MLYDHARKTRVTSSFTRVFLRLIELFIPFSFWPTKLQKYYIIFYLITFFLNFCLACLACFALQGAKAEHMEIKVSKPIFGILVALTKNELTKICNEPGKILSPCQYGM
jgi:hypothetical protein